MRLTRRTDYALRVLVFLVESMGRGPVPIGELAARNDVPKRFLEQIMLDLKQAGWVTSRAGVRGGYELAKPPDQITMGQVVRYFDGVLAPIGCVSVTRYEPCPQEGTCRFRRVLLEVRNLTAKLLDGTTLADVIRGKPVTQQEVGDIQFAGGGGI
jgi:Rrf2 family protein